MGIDNPSVIDAISTSQDGLRVSLTIFDAEDWFDEAQHLFALQEKLNTYFGFIESGQLMEQYPDAAGKGVVINVVFQFAPTATGLGLVERADAIAPRLGASVRYQVGL